MQIIKLKIDELKPYERNTKIHTAEQIQQIKDSIEKFGNNDPIAIATPENIIIAGNGRYLALKELGYTEVECIRLDHLTEAERKAYAIAHNKINANTGFDNDLLTLELNELQDLDFDLELTGFADWELEELFNSEDVSEDTPEKDRRDLSDTLKENYELIVKCNDENDLESIYEELTERGYVCQISTL